MRAISPARFAEQADAPVLLIHGKDDTVVPIEQSERMASALKHADKPYDYIVMPGEITGCRARRPAKPCSRRRSLFVEKYNPPD